MAGYSHGGLQAALKPSPSLIYNNLCPLGWGLAYAHTRTADTQQPHAIQSLASCSVGDSQLLALAYGGGLQVWDQALSGLLYVWKQPATDAPGATHIDFVRGLAFNMAVDGEVELCAGTSSGAIQVFTVSAGPIVRPIAVLEHHKQPITALGSAFQSSRGAHPEEGACHLVSADESGLVCMWEAEAAGRYAVVQEIKGEVPCSAVQVRGNMAICGRIDGSIKIYDLTTGHLLHDIAAHSRWLSAMDLHPSKPILATAAEDCTLNAWQLPVGGKKVSSLLSVCCVNRMLTGVAFCGSQSNRLAAVACDNDELHIWELDV